MDSDRLSTDRADTAASRNVLSGKAHSSAQVHTVFGGMHMYDTPPPGKVERSRTPGRSAWITNFLALIAIIFSLASLLLVLRRVASPIMPSMNTPTSHLPKTSKQTAEVLLEIEEMAVPSHREEGRLDYLMKIPEIANVYSFQAFHCDGRVYHQVLVGALWAPKHRVSISSVARAYGDKFAAAAWWPDAFSRYQHPQSTSRSSYGSGSTYPGVEIFGAMPLTADNRCGIDAIMIGVLALDCGDDYCVFVVLVGAGYRSPGGQRQAEQDVRFILDSIAIDFDR